MTILTKERVSSFCVLALGIFGGVFFLSHSYGLGDARGYSSLNTMDVEIANAEARLSELVEKREWLEQRIDLVSESSVDADLLGELARSQMGLYAPEDIVINLN